MVDLLEEARKTATIRSARYQKTLRRYHKRKIQGRTLEVSDLILRRTQSTKNKHQLSPPWEGPYTVAKVIRSGAYRLKDDNGDVLTNTWNIEQLHRFFAKKFGLIAFFHSMFAITKHPGPNTFGLGCSRAPWGCNTTSLFYYHMVNTFFTQTQG